MENFIEIKESFHLWGEKTDFMHNWYSDLRPSAKEKSGKFKIIGKKMPNTQKIFGGLTSNYLGDIIKMKEKKNRGIKSLKNNWN